MRDAEIKTLTDSFVENLATLRSHAIRALLQRTPLTVPEEADKSKVMERYWKQGRSLSLSYKDMTRLLLKGVLPRGKRCGCATCRARHESARADQPNLDKYDD